MSNKKIPYKLGLELVRDGGLTQDQFKQAIKDGLVAGDRIPGGAPYRRTFVSKDQEDFFVAKHELADHLNEAIGKSAKVAAFMEEYKTWEIDGKPIELEIKVNVKNFLKCLNSFTAEEE